ncbi:MAG: DUF411 domain-containing protein [Gemmatimonadales bacterium]
MSARLLRWTASILGVAVLAVAVVAGWEGGLPESTHVVMYKGAQCECCLRWGKQLTDAGFTLEVRIPDDLAAEFTRHSVPSSLMGCHVALVGDYVIAGHVPLEDIQRMLRERPAIAGLAVPGMPAGAPGMDYPGTEPVHFDVVAFDHDGKTSIYARH